MRLLDQRDDSAPRQRPGARQTRERHDDDGADDFNSEMGDDGMQGGDVVGGDSESEAGGQGEEGDGEDGDFDGQSGNDDEGFWQFVCGAINGNATLAHCLKQGGLGPWRRSIDFICEHDVGKNRTRAEFEITGVTSIDHTACDVTWQQVRSKLKPGKIALDAL